MGQDKHTNKEATLEAFRSILSGKEQAEPFDLDWVNRVATTAQRQRGVLVGVMALSFVPTAYLALFLFGKGGEVQLFGFKFQDLITVFEVSLLAMCLLGVYGARVAIATAQAEQLVDAWLEHKFGPTRARLYAYAYDPALLQPPGFTNPPAVEPTAATNCLRNCAFATFYVVSGVVMLAGLATQVLAIVWAIRHLDGSCEKFDAAAKVCSPGPNLEIVAFCIVITLLNVFAFVPYGIRQSFKS